ncbi:uncharacterized protein LOC131007791 [Salvia miltiorrhiza]|uniref:uncharacterized protein LOC131007791 n=1 Tax=Salvia miltiorrhiza TaxID=226208 RepID=UPI0025AD93B3|nr:uncharacterized protein LOC131007791 [Salvia miltiorrhiza]
MWEKTKKKKEKIPSVWFSLKNSLHCKSDPSDVHDPHPHPRRPEKHLSSILTKKSGRSGCSRSIANLKDVIHGSKRHLDRPPACSPRSIGSSEFLNPIAHEVIFTNSKCDLKITGFHHDAAAAAVGNSRPAPQTATLNTKNPNLSLSQKRAPLERNAAVSGGAATCHKCGEQFVKWEALESHHLSKHAVTELVEGDSSRKIVEIICRSSKTESRSVRIERVLKVHNMHKSLCRFEDYREMVKMRASKLPKKHPRCLADGNELLRFYGTHAACALGVGSSSLCVSEKCSVCRIIRHGFSSKREFKNGVGVFTTSTSGRALESIEEDPSLRKALIVCRVIAGRVHRPLDNVHHIIGQTGFDSLAGKVGLYSNVEELYLLSPKALLPCFVVICKTT